MFSDWPHAGPAILAAFLASLVEFIEALTIILAVGTVRGWRSALSGAGFALAVLLALVAFLGPSLPHLPQTALQLGVGTLMLLFGLRWLRKAILRASGIIPLHDETQAYAKQITLLTGMVDAAQGWDPIAVATAFKITMLEGIEVVFIVIAVGATGQGLLLPASLGAASALLLVAALGFALHKPIATIPENTLKCGVGILLTAFGTFWVGEGMGLRWPGQDAAIPALIAGFLLATLAAIPLCRARTPQ